MTNVLDEGTPSPEGTQETQETTLAALVGEGKKYSDVEALAASRVEADRFIEQLKSENEAMREALSEKEKAVAEAKTISDVLSAIDSRSTGSDGDNQAPEKSPEEIINLVNEVLDKRTASQKAEDNKNLVENALVSAKGESAGNYLTEELQKLGMSKEEYIALTKRNPNAALKLININPSQETVTPTTQIDGRGNVNTSAASNSGVRNKAFYRALRKEKGDGKFFNDFKLQQQMFKDRDSMSVEEWNA